MKYWVKMPSRWIIDGGLKEFKYSSRNYQRKNAANISALMMLFTLLRRAKESKINNKLIANCTYKEFHDSLGISRQSISMGLRVLESRGIISIERIGRINEYLIQSRENTWCKLPIRDVESIFSRSFSLRSQIELYALKLFLYFSAIRNRDSRYSMASYDRICEKTGIPRNFIKRTLSFMLVNDLLANVDRESRNTNMERVNSPNQYYLKGCNELVYYK